jgi:leader peptidase (prepilin peptidase)/N-methyltransferase
VPIVSFLALRGRCRTCAAPIPARVWWTEVAFAGAFVAVAVPLPGALSTPMGWGTWPLAITALGIWTLLLVAALVDVDTLTLPDSLVIPAAPLALAWQLLGPHGDSPSVLVDALLGAAVAVGVLMMVNRVGAWALRGGRDTRERLAPISFDSVNTAALVGLWAGLEVGLVVGAAQVLASAMSKRTWRLTEPAWLLLMLLGAIAHLLGWPTRWGLDASAGAIGALAAAGTLAWLGGVYWWLREARAQHDAGSTATVSAALDEPVALGFGDVKLAAPLGALLGIEGFIVAFLVSIVAGAAVGVFVQSRGGSSTLPFGPFLVLGGLVAWLWGDALLNAYLSLLGL